MKITPDHLARGAFIYVRQSTADQLANNHESRRRQYDIRLTARADNIVEGRGRWNGLHGAKRLVPPTIAWDKVTCSPFSSRA